MSGRVDPPRSRRAALLTRRIWHGLVIGAGGLLMLSLWFSAIGIPMVFLGVPLFLMVGDMAPFPDRHTVRWYWSGSIAELAAIAWAPVFAAIIGGTSPWEVPTATAILGGIFVVDGVSAFWLWRTQPSEPAPPDPADRRDNMAPFGSQEPLSSPCS